MYTDSRGKTKIRDLPHLQKALDSTAAGSQMNAAGRLRTLLHKVQAIGRKKPENAESLLSQITEELISGEYEAYGLEVHKILGVIWEVYRSLAP